MVQTHLQPPPLPLVETHARPVRRTRVGTGRRQGVGRSAGGGDQEVDLKVRNPVLGFVRSSRGKVLHGGMIEFWVFILPLGRNFLLLHMFSGFAFLLQHIHLLQRASAATWHNIGFQVSVHGKLATEEQLQPRTKLSLLNDRRLVGAAFVILLRSCHFLSFFSLFAFFTNSFSLFRASCCNRFDSALSNWAFSLNRFLVRVASVRAACAWKTSSRYVASGSPDSVVLIELEATYVNFSSMITVRW
jgi:hypothetical protein